MADLSFTLLNNCMKITWITIFAALVILAAPSCQKDYTPQTGQSTKTKLKTYIEDASKTPYNSIDTFNISYDASDRIISVSNSGGSGFYYTYTATSYTMDLILAGQLNIRDISYINSDQLVDSTDGEMGFPLKYKNPMFFKFSMSGGRLCSWLLFRYKNDRFFSAPI